MVHRCLVVALLAACGGGTVAGDAAPPDADPLASLTPSGELTLSPGNTAGQDEDATILRARDGKLYVAWFSDRNGPQPDGVPDREIFLMRSSDGRTWTDPPVQVTRHARYAFAPSLGQDAGGAFHLAWWRVIPTPEGCVPGVDCNGGTINRILYKSSPDGIAWDLDGETVVGDGPGDWLPSVVIDRIGHRKLVYFVSPVRDADGNVDLTERISRIYVSIDAGSGFGPPQRVAGVNADTSHNTFPFVVQAEDGDFLMTWTRYDGAAPFDVLHVISEPTTDTLFARSSDGVTFDTPVTMSGGGALDVFPALYADQSAAWNVLWLTAAPGASTGASIELAVGGSFPGDAVPRPELAGYTARVVATATPGIFWGVWVSGPTGQQKIRHRFFAR